jgi:diguanylate cyclase (GGDEF)-like protein
MMLQLEWFYRIDRFLNQAPRWFKWLLCILVIILLSRLDAIIQPHTSEDFLYVVTIMFAAWYIGPKTGIGFAVFAGGIWFAASVFDSEAAGSIPKFLLAWDAISLTVIYLIVALIISALKQRILELNDLARLDPLTGLYNRRAFYELVNLEAARSKRSHSLYTIAYIDVDNFKQVNDALGHSGGDEVLKEIGAILKHNLRQSDMMARMGGDEFVALLPDTDPEHGKKAIQKLFTRLNEAMRHKQIPVTFSIGVVTFTDMSCPVDDMIKKADSLMYSVKTGPKNGARFEIDNSCES